MNRRTTICIIAFMAFCLQAIPGWSQNNPQTGCNYSIQLNDYYCNSFYGSYVVIYNNMGTAIDTIAFPSDGQNGTCGYYTQFTAPEGKVYFRYVDTVVTTDNDYMLSDRYISVYDAEGNSLWWRSAWDAYYGNSLYFDSVTYHCPTCYMVSDVYTISIDSTSATIGWDDEIQSSASYLVTYWEDNGDGAPIALPTPVTGSQVTITGLQPNTSYNITIRVLCSAGDTSSIFYSYIHTAPRKINRIYVKASNNYNDLGGDSWANAFTNIQDAIGTYENQLYAYDNHPEIWVAAGTYYTSYLYVMPYMKVYGGFAGTETSLSQRPDVMTSTYRTIIDGQSSDIINGTQTLTAESESVWDGFTLTNGYTGAYLQEYNTLRNCRITNCQNRGVSAIGSQGNRWVALQNCIIEDNSNGYTQGIGIFAGNTIIDNCIIRNNSVTNNYSSYCSAVYAQGGVTLMHCDIIGNSSYTYSGFYGTASDTLVNCIVWGNTSRNNGSQIAIGYAVYDHCALPEVVNGNGNIVLSSNNYGSESGVNYPKFVDVETGDLRLNAGSACIDAGVNLGNASIHSVIGSAPDMGYYESDGTTFCTAPFALSVTNRTETSATITWQTGGGSTFHLQYAGNDGQWSNTITVNDFSYTITGLEMFGLYRVRVRSVCDNNQSDWSNVMTFRTACSNPVPSVLLNDGNNYNFSAAPINTSYPYSISYMLVKHDELGIIPRDIDTIGFYSNSSNTYDRHVTVKVATTNLENLTTDNIGSVTNTLQTVFEGTIRITSGYIPIPLQSPIEFDGMSNIVISVKDTTGTNSTYNNFACNYTDFNTIYSSGYNEGDLTYLNSVNRRPHIYLSSSCDMSSCPQPQITVDNVTDTSVTIAFQSLEGTVDVDIIRLRDNHVTTYHGLTISDSLHTFIGLSFGADYRLNIQSICSTSDSSRVTSLTFTTNPANNQHYYVKPVACGNADGTSWDNAYGDINKATYAAQMTRTLYGTNADVCVAAGTYYGDTVSNNGYAFLIYPGVKVSGGYIGNESNLDGERDRTITILDGKNERTVLRQNDYSYLDSTIWDGFTIQDGTQGVRLNSNGTLRNCIVRNCNAYTQGAGIYAYGATVENCTIDSCNSNSYSGGGIYVYYSTVRNSIVTNCAGYSGGAMYINGGTAENCLVWNNSAIYHGSGIYSYNNSHIIGCDIVENHIEYNSGDGAIHASGGTVENTVVWGNTGSDQIYNDGCNINNSAVQGGCEGTAIINLESQNSGSGDNHFYPMFTNPAEGDFTLQDLSPLIDGGEASQYMSAATDLAGNSRVFNNIIDIGCYESNSSSLCARPVNISIVGSGTSVLIGWQVPDSAATFELQYKVANGDSWTTVSGITEGRYMLASLQTDGDYEARLRTTCNNGNQSGYSNFTFSTRCKEGQFVGDSVYYYTNSSIPIRIYNGSSCSQQLFRASEMNGAQQIKGIKLQFSSSQVGRDIRIYLGHTNKNSFDDYIGLTADQLTLVVDRNIVFNNDSTWLTIPFDNNYNYNGIDNLVLAIYDSTDNYTYSYKYFKGVEQNFYSTVYYYYSGSIYNSSWYNSTFRSNVYFLTECDNSATCSKPLMLIEGVGSDTAALYCQTNLGVATQLQYRRQGDADWTSVTPSETVVITGLHQNSRYQARIRTICGAGDTSDWNIVNFNTTLRQQSRFHVKTTATGLGDGTTWDNATTLGDALELANANYTTFGTPVDVWVAGGTYQGNYNVYGGVNVYGGFAGNESSLDQRQLSTVNNQLSTILDAQDSGHVLYQSNDFDNGVTALWDGFTLQRASGSNNDDGAGVYMRKGFTLRNSVVRNCNGSSGIYANHGHLVNVTVDSCGANYGGGIYSQYSRIEGCTVTNCHNIGNYYGYGGGIYSQYDTIVNCIIAQDTGYNGGAINASYSVIVGSLFWDNASYYNTISLNYCTVVGNTLAGNRVYNSGNYCVDLNSSTMVNSIVWGNRGYGNSSDQMRIRNSGTVSNSAVQGGCQGSAIINLSEYNEGSNPSQFYPKFANTEDGDFRLMTGSQLINAGSSQFSSLYPQYDINGNQRVYGDTIDLGCYENNGEVICVRPATPSVLAGHTAAVVTWQAVASAQSYELQYSTADANTWTTVSGITGNSHLLSSLSDETDYLVRVRSYCGSETGHSPWSNTSQFHTGCQDDIIIGDTTMYDYTTYIPVYTYYRNSYSQSIYHRDEIGGATNISSIKYKTRGSDLSRNIKLYLGHIARSNFEQDYSPIPASDLTLVFDGTLAFSSDTSWLDIPLQTNFVYNGNDNLVVAMMDYTGSYSSSTYFAASYVNESRGIYTYSYSPIENLSDYSMSITSYIPTIRIVSACSSGSCQQPLLAASDITDTTARLICQNNLSGTLELQYKRSDSDNWFTMTPSSSVTLANLKQNTNYTARLRLRCSASDTSDWQIISFTTKPAHQDHYYVAATPSGRADGTSWSNATSDLQWAVNTAYAAVQQYHNAPEVWVAAGTYHGNFTMMPSVNVYGGFAGNEPATANIGNRNLAANITILDAQNNGRVLNQPYNFTATTAATWDGFTLQNANLGNNNSQRGGGAMLRQYGTLSNSIIKDCYAYYSGGAYIDGGSLMSCVIANDTSYNYAVVHNLGTVENCLIANNTVDYSEIVYNGSDASFNNNTVVNNRTTYDGNGYALYNSSYNNLYNNIIWGNRSNNNNLFRQTYSTSSGQYFRNCAIEGEVNNSDDGGNISLTSENGGSVFSPMFVQPSVTIGRCNDWHTADWRLQSGSVCVNRGNSQLSALNSQLDLDRTARVKNDTIDIGCYESNFHSRSLPQYGDIIYVKPTAAGHKDGTSWANATNDINRAVQIASMNNIKNVWVAAGTYYGGFTMMSRVNVYGGFVGNEPATFNLDSRDLTTNTTILDGGNTTRVLYRPDYSYGQNDTSIWDGFTLQNGFVGSSSGQGGGAYITENGILTNSIIRDCYAYNGGGVYLNEGTLTNSIITMDSCYNGAVYMTNYSTMENCLVSNNSSSYITSGVYCRQSTMRNNTIVCNASNYSSESYGVNIYSSYTYYGSTVKNNIIWGNRNMAGVSAQINNTTYGEISDNAVENGILIEGNYVLSTDNEGDLFSPRFVQPSPVAGIIGGVSSQNATSATVDWHLQQGSFCINRGYIDTLLVPSLGVNTKDLDGNSRIQHDTIDLGCYESPYSGNPLPEYNDSIIYVKSLTTGLGDGTTWDNAISDINLATRLAVSRGIKRVWVAAGTYYGNQTGENAFIVTPSVNVYGGFAGNELPSTDLNSRDLAANATILDGGNMRRVLYQPNDFSMETAAEWNGFTIQNGYLSSSNSNRNGAGAYICEYGTLAHCTITGNTTDYGQGAGVYLDGYSYTHEVNGQSVTDYRTKLVNCIVKNNRSSSYGGGVYSYYSLITGCLVTNNISQSRAGGIYSNSAYIMNSTIVGNTCANNSDGGGLFFYYGTMRNSIVWNNKKGVTSNNLYNQNNSANLYTSAIEGTEDESLMNIASTNDGNSPTAFYVRFNDPTSGDFTLHQTSSCIDQGDSTDRYLVPDYDLAFNNRWNGQIDLGCYEGNFNSSCPPVYAVTASGLSTSQATITWHTTDGGNLWTLRYRLENGEGDTSFVVNDSTVTLTGLQLNRTYMVYIRNLCSDASMSAWSIPAVFTTDCDPTLLAPLSSFTTLLPASGTVQYNENVDFGWNSIPEATRYDFYLWRDGDEIPTTPTRANLTLAGLNNIKIPNYNSNRGRTFKWYVVAWNECISINSDTLDLVIPYLPNLHVSGFTHSTPVSGQSVTFQWTVVNDGQGSTPPGETWNDYIWMTDGSQVGGGFLYGVDETLLATIPNLQSLAPGESYTNSYTVQLPNGCEGGRFFFVFADQYSANNIDFSEAGTETIPIPYQPSNTGYPYHYFTSQTASYPGNFIHSQIRENANSDRGPEDADNFFYKNVTVLPPPTPDLLVTDIQHPLNAQSDNIVLFHWTVTNNGDAAVTAESWWDAVYISTEPIFRTETAKIMGLRQQSRGDSNFAIGQSYTGVVAGRIPIEYNGTYYVYVITDINNDVYESIYESNNTQKSEQTMNVVMSAPPDLAVTVCSPLPPCLSANTGHDFNVRVQNVGTRAIHANPNTQIWWDGVFIVRADSVTDGFVFNPNTARRIGAAFRQMDLEAGEYYDRRIGTRIPDNLSGSYYFFIMTDINNEVFEYTFTDNNVYMYPTPCTINMPDLQPSWVHVPETVNVSKPFYVRWSIKTPPAHILGRNITDRIMLGDSVIFTSVHNNVWLYSSDSLLCNATIRLNCIPDATAQLRIVTDYGNNINESDETNNSVLSAPITLIAPDLVASNLTIGDSLMSSLGTTISWTLTNNGNAPVSWDSVIDNFYFAPGNSLTGASLIGSYKRHLYLEPGQSINESVEMRLPHGVYGTLKLHQVVNENGRVCEGANFGNNHIHTGNLTVALSPSPDMVITDINTAASYNLGETVHIDYTVRNQGTAPLVNNYNITKLFISQNANLNSTTDKLLGSYVHHLTIDTGAEATLTALVRIPRDLNNGNYYIYAMIDATDTIYEHGGENNNTKRSDHVLLKSYPLDLAATSLNGNTEVQWGRMYSYTLNVNNNSLVPTLANEWVDRIYISTDNVLQSTDIPVGSKTHRNPIDAASSYQDNITITIPMGMPTNCYLIAVVDDEFRNPDINVANNIITLPITISSVPTPDLTVSNVQILDYPVVSGQPYRIAYTVTNVGETNIVDKDWSDKVFLSGNSTYESNDIEIGSKNKTNFSLAIDSSYTDTVTFRVPLPQNGNMFLLVRANAGNNIFEANTANNIVAVSANVTLPNPGDLVVENISCEDSITSGQYLHINWNVHNIGENTLSGSGLRSLVYISTDNSFDSRDRLIGNVRSQNIMLPPDEILTQQASCRISGLPEGDYYLIVKTDVANEYYESNDTNNSSVSPFTVAVSVRNLPFNTPLPDTLHNNLANDYKLTVGNQRSETVRIHVDSEDTLSGAVNMIYVSHNNIGSDLNYTYSTIGQFTHSPELYIPATEWGYYGINVIGSTPTDSIQSINVQADILPFELRGVSPTEGGNAGEVTLELTGSRFRPDMQVWLQRIHRDGDTGAFDTVTLTPKRFLYDSYYRAFATYDLNGVDTGWYNAGVLNHCEGESVIFDAFHVVPGTPEDLGTNLIMPASPRPNRTVVMTLEFGNIGTVDITAPVVEIISLGDSYISLTNEGLSEHRTSLQIPLQVPGEPQGTIRPGAYGTISIYCYTSGTMIFSLDRIR